MAAAGAVAVVALALKVVGVADDVEFLATLLVAPVIVAALLGDRNLGYLAAGVAAVAYLSLRFGDIEDVGAAGVLVLVLFRAGSYGFVAYATPLVYARLAGDDGGARSRGRHLRAEAVDPGARSPFAGVVDEKTDAFWGVGGGEPVTVGAPPQAQADAWDAPPPGPAGPAGPLGPPEPAWSGVHAGAGNGAGAWGDGTPDAHGAPVSGRDSDFARAWQEAPPDDWGAEPAAAFAAPDEPAMPFPLHDGPVGRPPLHDEPVGRFPFHDEPPAPRVPTGWIDDATSPLGDETIPVGFTGELFLGKELGLLDPMERPPDLVPTRPPSNGNGTPSRTPPGGFASTGPGFTDDDFLTGGPLSGGSGGAGVSGGSMPDLASQARHWTDPVEPDDVPLPPRRSVPPAGPAPLGGPGAGGLGASRGTPLPPSGPPTPPGRLADRRAVGNGGPSHEHLQGAGAWPSPPGPSAAAPAAPDPGRVPEGAREQSQQAAPGPSGGVDPETRLWNARFFRDRLTLAVDTSKRTGKSFSVVMVQVPDEPFQPLPYRRQVALLRELGHQFVPRFVDHLVHLPDGALHWFAVVLDDTDRSGADAFERRLRATIAGYLRSRGLRVGEVLSASLTSPDDDEAMATVWASLLGADPHGVGA